MGEGFRSGSKLRKGRVSLGLGHKGAGLLLITTTELSVGVMEGCMTESASAEPKPQSNILQRTKVVGSPPKW
jgi:hypothetical protein